MIDIIKSSFYVQEGTEGSLCIPVHLLLWVPNHSMPLNKKTFNFINMLLSVQRLTQHHPIPNISAPASPSSSKWDLPTYFKANKGVIGMNPPHNQSLLQLPEKCVLRRRSSDTLADSLYPPLGLFRDPSEFKGFEPRTFWGLVASLTELMSSVNSSKKLFWLSWLSCCRMVERCGIHLSP